MSNIPKHIVERDKEGAESLTYYGVPVTELDRDELLAALCVTKHLAQSSFDNFCNMMEFNQLVRENAS
jgi:hypothetical protein